MKSRFCGGDACLWEGLRVILEVGWLIDDVGGGLFRVR
jgi:hypothetical protein